MWGVEGEGRGRVWSLANHNADYIFISFGSLSLLWLLRVGGGGGEGKGMESRKP